MTTNSTIILNSLHQSALNNLSLEWKRLREVTDRPEVMRDLLHFGLVDVKHIQGKGHNNLVTVWRLTNPNEQC